MPFFARFAGDGLCMNNMTLVWRVAAEGLGWCRRQGLNLHPPDERSNGIAVAIRLPIPSRRHRKEDLCCLAHELSRYCAVDEVATSADYDPENYANDGASSVAWFIVWPE